MLWFCIRLTVLASSQSDLACCRQCWRVPRYWQPLWNCMHPGNCAVFVLRIWVCVHLCRWIYDQLGQKGEHTAFLALYFLCLVKFKLLTDIQWNCGVHCVKKYLLHFIFAPSSLLHFCLSNLIQPFVVSITNLLTHLHICHCSLQCEHLIPLF